MERAFFVCLFGFLTSSSTTRLYRGRFPRLTFDNFKCCHTRDKAGRSYLLLSWSHYTDVTPTQPLGGVRPQRGSNPRPLHQESRALPTELPRRKSRGSQWLNYVKRINMSDREDNRYEQWHGNWELLNEIENYGNRYLLPDTAPYDNDNKTQKSQGHRTRFHFEITTRGQV